MIDIDDHVKSMFSSHPILSNFEYAGPIRGKNNLHKLRNIIPIECPLCIRIHDKNQHYLILSKKSKPILSKEEQTSLDAEEIINTLPQNERAAAWLKIKQELNIDKPKTKSKNIVNDNRIYASLGCYRTKGSFPLK